MYVTVYLIPIEKVGSTLKAKFLIYLFIDDKSTDNSAKIVQKYIQKYNSIEFYQLTKNTGGED